MILTVRPAEDREASFGWPLYREFIVTNVYPRLPSEVEKPVWIEQESTKFEANWKAGERYIIEIDDVPVGWIAIRKNNNVITVENIFLEQPWQAKGISARIISELTPTWQAEGRVVHVPVFSKVELTAKIKGTLEQLGFVSSFDDGMVQTMSANFTK